MMMMMMMRRRRRMRRISICFLSGKKKQFMNFEIKPTWYIIFLSMFIYFLYMFRATMCPSS
jgi:hypothetical protein